MRQPHGCLLTHASMSDGPLWFDLTSASNHSARASSDTSAWEPPAMVDKLPEAGRPATGDVITAPAAHNSRPRPRRGTAVTPRSSSAAAALGGRGSMLGEFVRWLRLGRSGDWLRLPPAVLHVKGKPRRHTSRESGGTGSGRGSGTHCCRERMASLARHGASQHAAACRGRAHHGENAGGRGDQRVTRGLALEASRAGGLGPVGRLATMSVTWSSTTLTASLHGPPAPSAGRLGRPWPPPAVSCQ